MTDSIEKILCETPTLGKQPTNIEKWKYIAVRAAILKALPRKGPGLLFKDLPALVEAKLPGKMKAKLGSISWYTTTVKLDLEVRGEIARVAGAKPQRLLRQH